MARNDEQWMPGKEVRYLEDRVARLERMTAHLFRALHQAQASNKARMAAFNSEIRPRLARLEVWTMDEGAVDTPETGNRNTAPLPPPKPGTHESDHHITPGPELPDGRGGFGDEFITAMRWSRANA